MRTIPGAVTHTVTDAPRNPRFRRINGTPNWLKAVYAFIAGLVAIVALSLAFAPASDSLPPCELEDGSTQAVCIWKSEHGLDVVNVDYGRYYYREVPQS